MKREPGIQYSPHKMSRSESILKTFPSLNSSILHNNSIILTTTNQGDSCSKVCQNSYTCIESYSEFTTILDIDHKIKKLRLLIMKQFVKEAQPNNKKYLMRSEELCNSILQIRVANEKSIKYLKDFCEETEVLIDKYEGTRCIHLLLQMLHSLCFSKLFSLRTIILLSQKIPMEKSKSPVKMLDNNKNIQQNLQILNKMRRKSLDSYILEIKERPKSQMSKITYNTSKKFYQNREMMFSIFSKNSNFQCNRNQFLHKLNKESVVNQLEKIFQAKCLNNRTKLSNHNPTQQISFNALQRELMNKDYLIKKQDQVIDDTKQESQIILDVLKQLPNKQPQFYKKFFDNTFESLIQKKETQGKTT